MRFPLLAVHSHGFETKRTSPRSLDSCLPRALLVVLAWHAIANDAAHATRLKKPSPFQNSSMRRHPKQPRVRNQTTLGAQKQKGEISNHQRIAAMNQTTSSQAHTSALPSFCVQVRHRPAAARTKGVFSTIRPQRCMLAIFVTLEVWQRSAAARSKRVCTILGPQRCMLAIVVTLEVWQRSAAAWTKGVCTVLRTQRCMFSIIVAVQVRQRSAAVP